MRTWADLTVDVMDDLVLDPRNIRLETLPGAPESDIIQDLFANEKALSLVEAIVKVGFLTHELPVVVRRGDEIVVVEGNRRVAALKAIQNPYLAPSYTAKIKNLIGNLDRESLRTIQVKQAPSQEEADQLIAALHTGQQRVPWKPARQQAFFQAQIDAGKTLSVLIEQYPTVDVIGFVGESRILQLFREAAYQDADLKKYVNTRRFPISTLARLYGNEEFLDLVGIRHDRKTAKVELTADPRVFNVVAEAIIKGIKHEGLNTRTLNRTDSASYKRVMDELRELINNAYDQLPEDGAAPPKPTSSASPSDVRTEGGATPGVRPSGGGRPAQGASPGQPNPSPPPQPTPPPAPKPRRFLDMEGITVDGAYPAAIHAIFQELSSLNVERFPNATLDLIRTFLEKTIKAYAVRANQSIVKTNNQNGFVQLGDCLSWLESHFKSNGPKQFIQVVVKIRTGRIKDYLYSQDHLNAINHNHEILATPTDVRETWIAMRGLMKELLK